MFVGLFVLIRYRCDKRRIKSWKLLFIQRKECKVCVVLKNMKPTHKTVATRRIWIGLEILLKPQTWVISKLWKHPKIDKRIKQTFVCSPSIGSLFSSIQLVSKSVSSRKLLPVEDVRRTNYNLQLRTKTLVFREKVLKKIP